MAKGAMKSGNAKTALSHYRAALSSSPRSRRALRGAAAAAEMAAKQAADGGAKASYRHDALRYYRQYNHFHPGNERVEASIQRLEGS
jgi:hypothetical protein